MKRTTRREGRRAGARTALGLLLLFARVAAAQTASTGIAADRFVPAVGPASLLQTEAADTTPRGQVASALSVGYLRDPIKLTERFTGTLRSEPVRGQLVMDTSVEFGLPRGLALAVGLPVVLWNDGDRLRGTGVDEARL